MDKVTDGKHRRTCFVISPVGDEESPTRIRADNLLELVVEPALEIYDFTVIRADRMAGSHLISYEVIDQVQNADLCIIDLTDHNANVFYECGRRHETGKPFVQLIQKGETLPFDVAGIRTIFYELDDPRAIRATVEDLRSYVEEFEDAGYSAPTGAASLSALSAAIERLDRKIDRAVSTGLTRLSGRGAPIEASDGMDSLLKNPREAFLQLFAAGRLEEAVKQLPRIREISGTSGDFGPYAALAASAGSSDAKDLLLDLLREGGLDTEAVQGAVAGCVRFYSLTDREAHGVDELVPIVTKFLEDAQGLKDLEQAFLFNQMAMLYFGAKDYEQAQIWGLRAIELNPDEVSYKYNMSYIYEARGLLDLAEEIVDQYMADIDSVQDGDHLGQAIDIYLKRGRSNDARQAFDRLTEVSPEKANLKAVFDENVRALLQTD